MFKKIFNILEQKDKFKLKIIFFFVFLSFIFEFITLTSLSVFASSLINVESTFTKLNSIIDLGTYINLNPENLVKFLGIFIIIAFTIKNLFFVILLIFQSRFLENLKKKYQRKYSYIILIYLTVIFWTKIQLKSLEL